MSSVFCSPLTAGTERIVLTLGALGAALLTQELHPTAGGPPFSPSPSGLSPPGQLHPGPSPPGHPHLSRTCVVRVQYMPALPAVVVNLSGAGDSLVGGLIAALATQGGRGGLLTGAALAMQVGRGGHLGGAANDIGAQWGSIKGAGGKGQGSPGGGLLAMQEGTEASVRGAGASTGFGSGESTGDACPGSYLDVEALAFGMANAKASVESVQNVAGPTAAGLAGLEGDASAALAGLRETTLIVHAWSGS